METITLQGTEEQFNELNNTLGLATNELPQEVEIRVYVLDTQDISIDKGFEELTEEEWIEQCERQGRVYSLQGFAKAFNEEEINTSIDVVKIINIKI